MIGNGLLDRKAIVGELFIVDSDSYSVTVTEADTYQHITNFTAGTCKGIDTNEEDGSFIVANSGYYMFSGAASLKPSIGTVVDLALFVYSESSGMIIHKIQSGIDFKNSQDMHTFASSGILYLNKGDIVYAYGKASNVPLTMSIKHLNICLVRVGS